MEKIRRCRQEDKRYIEEMAKLIWEGYDYLPEVFDEWVNDGGFFVVEEDGRVIGTVKITILPEKVGWLEGLRVHPDYRGRGIGKRLNEFILTRAKELRNAGEVEDIEFSTYFRNVESLSITKKSGFRVVKGFYVMYRDRDDSKRSPDRVTISREDLMDYSEYLSCGWRFVRNTDEGYRWLSERMKGYSAGEYKFYVSGHEESAILLNSSEEAIVEYTKALNSICGEEEGYEVFLPEEWGSMINLLKDNSYRFWEEDVREPNIIILRYSN